MYIDTIYVYVDILQNNKPQHNKPQHSCTMNAACQTYLAPALALRIIRRITLLRM